MLSIFIIALFFGGFVGWASFAPLESAVVGKGLISPSGSRRVVQHLEGGVIQDILVKDGDKVDAGQILVRLNDTQSDAAYKATSRRVLGQRALVARLEAEVKGQEGLLYPDVLLASSEPDLLKVLNDQREIFSARLAAFKGQQSILEQQAAQMREQINGFNQQASSVARQLELIQSETEDVEGLIAKGLERRPRLLALQRTTAALEGQRSSFLASIAQAQQRIGEGQMQMATLEANRRNQASDELAKVQNEVAQLNEQLRAQEDIRARAEIVSPVAGTVVDLRFKSAGGVIRPGEAVLDIVPKDEEMLIDARLSPMDVDSVQVGQSAEVLLTGYRLKFMPRTIGEVTYVSADILRDANTGGAYYEVKVRVPPEERAKLAAVDPPVRLVAGMPAEVFVVTGETRVMAYLLNPLVEIIRRTFRESNSI
jgi:HlyD family secretion protein/epimerase transport system membrane fusion protein